MEESENWVTIKRGLSRKEKDRIVEVFIHKIKEEEFYNASGCKRGEEGVVLGLKKHKKPMSAVVVSLVDNIFTISDKREMKTLQENNSELWGVTENKKLKRIKTGPLIEKNELLGKPLHI